MPACSVCGVKASPRLPGIRNKQYSFATGAAISPWSIGLAWSPACVNAIGTDNSVRKQVEAELTNAKAAAEKANLAKSDFFVQHES